MTMTVNSVRLPKAGTYELDPSASSIEFRTHHMFGLGKVAGAFELESAKIRVAADPAHSNAEAVVDATSFTSGGGMRDKQVRSEKFLGSEANPRFIFASTRVHKVSGDWVVEGMLTVRGMSEPVRLTLVEASSVGDVLTVVATTRVDRYAYGIRASRGMAGRHLDVTLRLTARLDH
jgi:polyisoprenoid-binding protein YceI